MGVASQSHKAIHNLLDEVERAAGEERLDFQGLKQGQEYDGRFIRPGATHEFADPEFALIAGTSWLFTREDLDQTLDVLVIDEAGQISLADALAMGTSARSIILLGDPLQLAQVSQGVHPPGSGASVLEHLLAENGTIPEDRGIFLTQTRRMHPAVCTYVSEAFYEGRLDPIAECAERSTSLGVGIRWLPIEHDGNRVESEQEAGAIAAEIERVLGRDVHRPGRHPAAPRLRRDGGRALQRPGAAPDASACRRASRSAPSTSSRAARRRSSSTRWRPRAARTSRTGSSSCSRATA